MTLSLPEGRVVVPERIVLQRSQLEVSTLCALMRSSLIFTEDERGVLFDEVGVDLPYGLKTGIKAAVVGLTETIHN